MDYPREIIDEYLSGSSTVVLSKKYGIHYSSIRKFLINNGVQLRSNKENSRVYNVDHNIFSVIDTEEKAYWLGFLSADGYVSSVCGKRVGLSIAIKDYDHIVKFNEFINSTYTIHTYVSTSGYSNSEYCRVIISSDAMYDDLVRHGVVEHKSEIFEYPYNLSFDLQRHFLRGYNDGDGCITKNGNAYSLKIMGTDNFLDGFVSFLKKNDAYEHSRKEERRKGDVVKSLIMNGKTAFNAIKLMYSDSNISLDRKYDKASEALCYFSRLYE